LLLHQQGEVQAGRTAANADDVHGVSRCSVPAAI
jgi:hypothetical protein